MSVNTMPLSLSPRLVGYFRRTRAEVSAAAFKLAFAMLVVASAFGATYVDAKDLFSESDLTGILVHGAVVSSVPLLAVLVVLRSKTSANVALALVTVAGVLTAYVVHTELFYPENLAVLIGICGAGAFALFVAFRIVDELRWGGTMLSAAALAAIGMIVAPALMGDDNVVAGQPAWLGEESNIRSIMFRETPNVYFVGFESLVPKSIMQSQMGIESTDVHDLFDSEARRFRNFFANAPSTETSFNTLLSLDDSVFMEYRRRVGDPGLFSGQWPSPLIKIMKENGYETTSIYNNRYLGYPKGQHVDNYFISGFSVGICSLLDGNVRSMGFWGYCTIDFKKGECPLNKTLYRFAVWGYCKVFGSIVGRGSTDLMVHHLTSVGGEKPQFVIAHVPTPGHTPPGFQPQSRDQVAAFAEGYQRGANRAAIYMRQIIDHVKNNDPEAILFMFGDHGAFHSLRPITFEDDPRFFVLGRYAILGGVYPPDRCAEYLDEAESRGYMTTLDAVHAILKCLSGGESALVESRNHQLRIFGDATFQVDPKEFLYE